MSLENSHPIKRNLLRFLQRNIQPFLYIFDVIAIFIAWRFSSHITLGHSNLNQFLHSSLIPLVLLTLTKITVYYYFGLYRALLRYASFHFAATVVKAVLTSSCLIYPVIYFLSPNLPVEIFIIDLILTMFFIGFSRFFPRYYAESFLQESGGERKILIYGAGEVGDSVARSLLRQKNEFCPIGFIDDNSLKIGRKVHNLPILGKYNNLDKIIEQYNINELIVAISNYPAEKLRELVKKCRLKHVICRLVPLMPGASSTQEINIKNIDIVDLLRRNPQDLDENQIDNFLRGKRILVTGAAGSIGSELIHQIMRFNPAQLVMIDNSEFGLYNLEEKLREKVLPSNDFYSKFRFLLQDISQEEQTYRIMKNEKPDIVFHAAAYKHVPLIERNPFNGVINNIKSTLNIANAANSNGVKKFVLISSDKAVRPTNIMGATKRICELYVQNLDAHSKTDFVSVRFGNVLGSSGSVIPKFLRQINNGGPITVTHPEVVRYFMLIEEAVKLVMQAASIGHGGEIFILDMGDPIKIKEMAEDLIFLAGKEPYRDINIQFTGLRPGEKLYEELLIDETEKKTQFESITIGKTSFIDWMDLNMQIEKILETAQGENYNSLLLSIKDLIPEFNHSELPIKVKEKKVV